MNVSRQSPDSGNLDNPKCPLPSTPQMHGHPPKESQNSRKSRWQDGWLWEVLSAIFSNICFVVLCGVLLAYDSERRPDERSLLSLNTVVSVLSTACKSSLILAVAEGLSQWKWLSLCRKPTSLSTLYELDNASRGPLGSVMILFRLHNHALVYIGAAVLTLFLFVDPFFQQSLSYPIRLTDSGTGSGRAVVGQSRSPLPKLPYTPSWETAYYRALWSDGFGVHPSCPSGNCTWPPFQTVGYCNQCTDRTAEATIDCHEQLPKDPTIATGPYTRCEVGLPGKPNAGGTPPALWSPGTPDQMPLLELAVWNPNINPNISDPQYPAVGMIPNLEEPILELATAQLGTNETLLQRPDENLWDALFLQYGTTCRFSLCIWEYDVSVTSSVVFTGGAPVDNGQFFYADNDFFSNCWVPYGGSTETPARTNIPNDISLLLNTTELRICDILELRNDEFWGIVERLYTLQQTENGSGIWESNGGWETSTPAFARIQEIGLEDFMSRLAVSLTEMLIDESNYTIEGIVWTPQAFVEVRWAWLVLPALVVLAGNVFFVLTLHICKRENVPPWKSSTLALLYHGLEIVDHDDYGYTSASRMEEMAATVELRLGHSDQDGRLVLQKS